MFLIQTNIFISVLRFRQIAAPATRFKYSNGAAQAYLKKSNIKILGLKEKKEDEIEEAADS